MAEQQPSYVRGLLHPLTLVAIGSSFVMAICIGHIVGWPWSQASFIALPPVLTVWLVMPFVVRELDYSRRKMIGPLAMSAAIVVLSVLGVLILT